MKNYDADIWRAAAERAAATPVYAGSHRKEAANQVGALGELVFESLLTAHGIPFQARYQTTEDLEILGDTVEVKTKDRTARPQPGFGCSVPLYNHEHQRPSRYVFVSLLRDRADTRETLDRFTRAYVVGWSTLAQVDAGRTWSAGEVDPDNGTRFWTACKNVLVNQLRPMEELLAEYRRRAGLER